jgi:hypothetical protein
MEIPVLIEPVAGNGYRAKTGEPLALAAEGATADEAIRTLQGLIAQRLAHGARIVSVTVPEEHPWLRFAGTLKDDPLFDEWQQAIAERRREMDNDPNVF